MIVVAGTGSTVSRVVRHPIMWGRRRNSAFRCMPVSFVWHTWLLLSSVMVSAQPALGFDHIKSATTTQKAVGAGKPGTVRRQGETPVSMKLGKSEIEAFVEAERTDYERSLKELVDIPSVSMDPAHQADIERIARKAAEILKQAGVKSQVIPTGGNPIVYGEFLSKPGDPTVLVYNHLDVQPADLQDWASDPFVMAAKDGIYRGRGTTDDKGPALAVMYAAKYASQKKIPINIKFVWELEEEIGSPSFGQFVKDHESMLAADSVVVSDTIWVSADKPAIPYGLRGLQALTLKLRTGRKDVHSGLTGGLARNPIAELCEVISLCGEASTGVVTIPGFYDRVRKPSSEELDDFLASGLCIDGFKSAHELESLRSADPRDAAERIWARPTFEVHGITGGYTGPGVKTVVPHRAEAKVSMRLVPDQDPAEILELMRDYLGKIAPDVQIEAEGALKPYLGEFTGPFAQAARQAMLTAFGKQPAFTREGGSIGAVVSMNEILRCPVVFLGLSLPEHGYHAVNENFDWKQASGGIKMFAEYFRLLAQMKK